MTGVIRPWGCKNCKFAEPQPDGSKFCIWGPPHRTAFAAPAVNNGKPAMMLTVQTAFPVVNDEMYCYRWERRLELPPGAPPPAPVASTPQ
ncbi:MAG: hypothetical protein ACREEN_00520 [Stellaceae bacterium]